MHTPNQFVVAERSRWRGSERLHRFTHVSRQLTAAIRNGLAELNLQPGQTVLDFGCADQPYRAALPPQVRYFGADLPGNPLATVALDAEGRLPADFEPVDAIFSTQVLEHVSDPALYVSEAFRALKPGGKLLLSTHGLMVYHPDPIDLWRWTGAGLKHAVTKAGFRVQTMSSCVGLGATGVQFVQDALLGRIHRRLHRPLMWVTQRMMGWMDRHPEPPGETGNAMVYVVMAQRPPLSTSPAP